LTDDKPRETDCRFFSLLVTHPLNPPPVRGTWCGGMKILEYDVKVFKDIKDIKVIEVF